VHDRLYLQADFWLVRPDGPWRDPEHYLTGDDALPAMAREIVFAGDVRDDSVSAAVLNGEFLTVRRVGRKATPDRLHFSPLYVIVVGPAAPDDSPRRERDALVMVTKLADLEARTGDLLDHVQHDLYVWRNHLEVYHLVATSGARLWDGLAAQLPIRRARGLAQVHATMELMHQVLLQGIADLAHLATLTHALRARVNATAAELEDRYDDAITERAVDSHPSGIRASLAQTGLIRRLIRSVDEVAEQATLVQRTYGDLLEAITKAFDERRVREADAMQRASASFAIIIALVGVVTVLDATLDLKLRGFDVLTRQAAGAGDFSIVIGLVLMVSAVYMTVRMLRLGRLGSRAFRRRYHGRRPMRSGLLEFLGDSSTETLESVRDDPAAAGGWEATDADLSRRLALLWDQAGSLTEVRAQGILARAGGPVATVVKWVRGQSDDLHALARRIERWCLHGLLVTERARRLYRYRLPLLTLVYRCLSRLDGSFFQDRVVTLAADVNVVAPAELERVLQDLGMGREAAREIDHELLASRPRTAVDALARAQELLERAATATRPGGVPDPRLPEPGPVPDPAST
jgi:hypothetical protein